MSISRGEFRLSGLTLALFVSLATGPQDAPSEPAVDPNVVLRVSLASDQRAFHVGETIPLVLSFSTALKDRYEINMAQYDRSGRMEHERFRVSPAGGAGDPLAHRPGGIGGGLTSFQFLGPEPWTIALSLNEWLRFTRPGEYRLGVTSTRVGIKDPTSPLGASPVTARADELKVKIVPATRAWQRAVYDEAVATLDQPRKPQDLEAYTRSRRQAAQTLGFLGTEDATRELAKRLRGEDPSGLDAVCMLGLIGIPDREVSRRALEEALADPDQPIGDTFLYTLQVIGADPEDRGARWAEDRREAVEQLLAVLPSKHGQALSVSLRTAVSQAWDAALPAEITEKLAERLIAMFDTLPEQEQTTLLKYRWDRIGRPAMLPIVRRHAQVDREPADPRDSKAQASLELRASALRRWHELDPQGARPAIIQEIARPHPRYPSSTP